MLTEEILRQAAQEAGQAIAESFPDPEDCHHEFSLEFERKMKPILRRARYQGVYTALRRTACVLVMLVLSCATWLGVDAQARETFFGWVSQRVENAQRYFFSGELAEEETSVHYSLPVLPSGLQEYHISVTEHEASYIYIDEKGFFFEFGYLNQDTVSVDTDVFFSTGDAKQKAVYVNGAIADLYIDESGSTGNLIVWRDTETNILLYIDAYLDEETLIHLAESVLREF